MSIRKPLAIAAAILLALGFAAKAGAQGPPGGTIYAHDTPYHTIGTPADLPDQGRFNTIYLMGDGLANVSASAPGDRDWRGGRWEVRPITWLTISPTQFTNAEDVLAAAGRGELSIGDVVRRFECPLIRAR